MWKRTATLILRNRIVFIIVVALITAFMAYQATGLEMDYHYASMLPETDTAFIEYKRFKEQFGEDGNV